MFIYFTRFFFQKTVRAPRTTTVIPIAPTNRLTVVPIVPIVAVPIVPMVAIPFATTRSTLCFLVLVLLRLLPLPLLLPLLPLLLRVDSCPGRKQSEYTTD